ncbi:hypothetical protein BB559_001374 [Furculomyces boomerangus]|uniref:WD40 repeat-containing protein SMU1 n=2 Tax=Harpellales TaxID=61421 RepID=A0A2T9Z266_9FUNG|nr:hypothetical protein BB559_001374 [Furculomyces boomerangus]
MDNMESGYNEFTNEKSENEMESYIHEHGFHKQCVKATDELFDENNSRIKTDMIRIIGQYLDDNGFTATKTVLYDEANIRKKQKNDYLSEMVNLTQAIIDGEWEDVDRVCSGSDFKSKKGILYRVYKQQYLELIEEGEFQKAFSILTKRLKPLERHQTFTGEFRDLCYLLTAKSIQDAPLFKGWDGILSARQKLADDLQSVLELEIGDREVDNIHVPRKRLTTLLSQAVAYQIESNRYHVEPHPSINTILVDYEPIIVPNTAKTTFTGHQANAKCVAYVGDDGDFVASGSSDNTIKLWNVETGECISTLYGHTSRVWDLCIDKAGSTLFSASGDRTVKVWDIKDVTKPKLVHTISESTGDVYSVSLHPLESHVVLGGYDRTVRLFDLVVGRVVQTFSDHELSVSSAIINPLGNLLITGSKDHTVKFWDIMSGSVVNNIRTHLGEVTSVCLNNSSVQLLTSAKDNSNRLWDLRTLKPLCKYKGHQNTSKNFIKSNFMNDSLITGGSENGKVYIWNKNSGEIVSQLEGHEGISYEAKWHAKRGLLCSASDDKTLKTWYYKT